MQRDPSRGRGGRRKRSRPCPHNAAVRSFAPPKSPPPARALAAWKVPAANGVTRAHAGVHAASRRRALGIAAAWIGAPGLVACGAWRADAAPWEARLRGSTIALLGEVHDNAEHHRQRTSVLRRAFASGWRPAVVMEQFDIDRQADIDRARIERPRDAAHVIALAGAARGWDWRHYEPVIALALEHDAPLLAGNLPRATAARLVRDMPPAVFGSERARELGLDVAPDAAWQAAQEQEIDRGHCGALPPTLWPGMARGQFARDAVMAQQLQRHVARGAVLLAGNGHVRRDLGVPRWLPLALAPSVLAVGFVEADDGPPVAPRFDAVVVTAPAERADPCATFKPPRAG